MLPCKKNRLVLQYLYLKNQKLNRTGIFICATFFICNICVFLVKIKIMLLENLQTVEYLNYKTSILIFITMVIAIMVPALFVGLNNVLKRIEIMEKGISELSKIPIMISNIENNQYKEICKLKDEISEIKEESKELEEKIRISEINK